MGWMLVLLAGMSEVVGVVGLKTYTNRKSFKFALMYVGGFILSFALLYGSLRYLQLSVAYAVWGGIGTAGGILVNMLFFGEGRSALRIVSLCAVVVGVVGLKALS